MTRTLFMLAAAVGVGALMSAPSSASAGGRCGYAVPAYTYTYTTCCVQVTCGYTYSTYRSGYVYPSYAYTYPSYTYPRRAARRAWRRGY